MFRSQKQVRLGRKSTERPQVSAGRGSFMRLSSHIAAFAAAVAVSASAYAAQYQTTGHTDIRFLYDAATGTADVAYFLDQNSIVGGQPVSAANPMGGTPVTVSGGATKIRFEPTDLITFVPNPSVARPASSSWNPTGVTAGEPLWYIPQSQLVDRPWTGISTESVSSATFSNIRYQLTAFSGPGQMSVSTTGSFGTPTFYFSTVNGLSTADVISVNPNTHAHYNWYFTAPGTYTFDLTVTGTRTAAAGGGTVSATDTFTFQVVPEPSSLAALGVPAALLLRRRARQLA